MVEGTGDKSKAVVTVHELSLVFLESSRDGHNMHPAQVFAAPEVLNTQSIRYTMGTGSGRELHPGEYWHLIVPPRYRNTPLQYAVLKHRKDPRYASVPENSRDPDPAYILFQAHDPKSKAWFRNIRIKPLPDDAKPIQK